MVTANGRFNGVEKFDPCLKQHSVFLNHKKGLSMKITSALLSISVLIFATGGAAASSDAAWAALDKASAKACLTASGFLKAKVAPSTHFSDAFGYDARMVSGTYPQKHMKGATGQMLCLYARKTKQVEVQELAK
jgi:hypothetical protein